MDGGVRELISRFRTFFVFAGLFSLAINALLLVPPIYMLQVFDRVLTSRSEETLVYLTIGGVTALVVMALLAMVRARLLGVARRALYRRCGTQRRRGDGARHAARRGEALGPDERCRLARAAPGSPRGWALLQPHALRPAVHPARHARHRRVAGGGRACHRRHHDCRHDSAEPGARARRDARCRLAQSDRGAARLAAAR